MRSKRANLRKAAAEAAVDLGGIIGAGLVIAGLWWIYEPAALIAAGLTFVAISVQMARIRQ